MKQFLFDEDISIDVNALESYVVENREHLSTQDEFEIDLSQMTSQASKKATVKVAGEDKT